ncbi:U1 small nuclear ribonucleoprotein A [Chloropicon primus]|uniref:U1 small nuclear ribonucleoprotein A n=1 Tax=Chloropicon primus TaxID=1764295 RepID=A0A5B8MSV7_9CHLO|nr:U1 small nuclear ribonucleoprotein A [Chloropicon primus]UPR02138.1 U1 small nuclear ribonucleoprotein A [Chloropicon primus]|eukprot:QDZ22914.1 U1 small nuclear ribonucleoprotein A [Chloropicon primus]
MSIDGSLPNQTVYVSNLYEKLSKDELRKSLHAVFSQFGKILDIVCMKNYRLRGQAWVVFEDITSATNALRLMQGFPFYDKPMKIAYAKTKSDAVAKLDGTYVSRDKAETARVNKEKREALQKRAAMRKGGSRPDQQAPFAAGAALAGTLDSEEPPHNILFVQNLPPATSQAMIAMLFEQFPGFKEVRMVETRPGIAFVEFGNEMESSVALSGLQGFQITKENSMRVSYAKK